MNLNALPPPSRTLNQAEHLFTEKLYGDALPLYELLLSQHPNENQDFKSLLALRLATCHLEERNPQEALHVLSPLKIPSNTNHVLYLMSRAHRQLGQSSQALSLLQDLSPRTNDRANALLIQLEKGFNFLQINDLANAQSTFESISLQENDPLPYQLAQLQLIKIQLNAHRWEAANQLLTHLTSILSLHPLLQIEKIYLEGLLLLETNRELQASECLEQLLPQALTSNTPLSIAILRILSQSYLRSALCPSLTPEQTRSLLAKALPVVEELIKRQPTDNSYFLLNDLYLIKAKRLSDSQAYAQAQQLYPSSKDLFTSTEEEKLTRIKFAEAAPTYEKREQLYQIIIDSEDYSDTFRARAWLLKGLNHFDEGLINQKSNQLQSMCALMKLASEAFIKSVELYDKIPSQESVQAFKYLALSYVYQSNYSSTLEAWKVLDTLLSNPALVSTLDSPQEMYCLAGWIALHLSDKAIHKKSLEYLEKDCLNFPGTQWSALNLKLKGLLLIQKGEWKQADDLFAALLNDPTQLPTQGEAWFWRAHCAELQGEPELRQKYLQQVYYLDPHSSYAPVAFFHVYSYREYMLGQRKALKHLQAMPLLFPNHPLLISAYYLTGLDHKKDRLSEEGQVVRRKDLTAAIEAFQLTESTFDALYDKKLIPASDIPYFIQVRYRAQLARALANFSIAQQSKGGKREIYLEYAEGVFKQLIEDFSLPHPRIATWFMDATPYPNIWAEAELKLALTYIERNKTIEAEAILDDSLKHYQQAQSEQGYWMTQVWAEKGKLAFKEKDYAKSLKFFFEAERAAGDFASLTPDEKLGLWILQSECYKELKQFDHAMLLLSKVINDDVISSLRIKAMYLRAELYEMENRPELALKQLEAAARKGGEWAQKAQKKLEQVYGYSPRTT